MGSFLVACDPVRLPPGFGAARGSRVRKRARNAEIARPSAHRDGFSYVVRSGRDLG